MKKRSKKGFTLIELIVVIAILGILALIAIPRFIGTLDNAKIKTDVATARAIVSAVGVGEAEGEYTLTGTTGPSVQDLVENDYLVELPVSSQNGGAFTINYVGGAISTITIGTPTGGTAPTEATVFPAP